MENNNQKQTEQENFGWVVGTDRKDKLVLTELTADAEWDCYAEVGSEHNIWTIRETEDVQEYALEILRKTGHHATVVAQDYGVSEAESVALDLYGLLEGIEQRSGLTDGEADELNLIRAGVEAFLPAWNERCVRAVAVEFGKRIRRECRNDEFAAILARNVLQEDSFVCHSHDFMDANVVMAGAFRRVVGRDSTAGSARDALLWGAAWDLAKAQQFMVKP